MIFFKQNCLKSTEFMARTICISSNNLTYIYGSNVMITMATKNNVTIYNNNNIQFLYSASSINVQKRFTIYNLQYILLQSNYILVENVFKILKAVNNYYMDFFLGHKIILQSQLFPKIFSQKIFITRRTNKVVSTTTTELLD